MGIACPLVLPAQQAAQAPAGQAPAAAQDSAEDNGDSASTLRSLRRQLRNAPVRYTPLIVWRQQAVIAAAFALVAAFLLSIPVALVYRYTTPAPGFDEAIAQSILILPTAVAGVILVVQGSLALAFSLAGVVTAVRFRSSLKDTDDAIYIFLAVAIGVAAGARALDIAVVVCVIVCLALLITRAPRFTLGHPLNRARPQAADGDATKPDDGNGESQRIYTVLVHGGIIDRIRPAIEQVLNEQSKGFQLTEAGTSSAGVARLVYATRIKKKTDVAAFESALNAIASQNGGHADVTTGPVSEEHLHDWEATTKADPSAGGGPPR
jgi:uncharacterized membrane protein YhiD involved in acid resistance